MKNILTFVAVLFTLISLQATELPNFRGNYYFNEPQLKLQQIQHVVRFVVSTPSGQELLKSYRQLNYACVYNANSNYLCKAFLKNLLEDQEVREEVITKFNNLDFYFTDSNDDYALVNEGEVVSEYEKHQKSSFAGQDFNKIHFYITPSLKKFKVFNVLGAFEHFYLNSDEEIAKQVQLSRANKKSSAAVVEDKYTYLYEGVWKQ